MEEMDSKGLYNLYLILMGVRGILYVLGFFVIIRIIGFWMTFTGREAEAERKEKLLKEILKELKEKNKE